MTATIDRQRAADFVDWFAEGWRAPTYESFCRHFGPRIAADVRMAQPLQRPYTGYDEFLRSFATLFAIMPDVHARVLDWRGDERVVYIEFRLEGTVGGRPVRLEVCDRFTLDGETVEERHSFFDPAPLLGAFLRRPWALLRLVRLRSRARALYETAPR